MKSVEISVEEIDYHPSSFCDSGGRVFWWKNELYRGIKEAHFPFSKRLFEEGIVQGLVRKNFLIDTELTDLTLNGYSLVLKHRCVPFISYANEWCPEMLRDAGLFLTDMMIELASHDLICDIDTWDLLFDGCQPVYVDFCSIMAANFHGKNSLQVLSDDFRSYFTYPLQLMAQGYGNLARWLLADYGHEVIHAEFAALMGHRIYNFTANHSSKNSRSNESRWIFKLVRQMASKGKNVIGSALSESTSEGAQHECRLAQQLRQELEGITLPSTNLSQGDDADHDPSLAQSDGWSSKHRSVHEVLSDLRPSTVLDIGSGRGWYSRLAASLGSNVVALDIDDRHVAHCYQEARKKQLPILPLVMDIQNPSPGHGTCNQVITPALQRLPCDLVLALSLVHLLVLDQVHTFDQVSQTFAAFSKRWLLVEFESREDSEARQRWSQSHSWYTLENFLDALRKQFRHIRTVSSHTEFRVLLLCEK